MADPPALVQRILGRTDRTTECWVFTGALTSGGYGSIKGRPYTTHKAIWTWANGREPLRGEVVRHTCDNPPCCRPDHLVIGRQRDNIHDALARGRSTPPPVHSGSTHHSARLTEQDVRAIRREHDTGRSMASLAEQYAVAHSTVRNIVHRHTWRSVA